MIRKNSEKKCESQYSSTMPCKNEYAAWNVSIEAGVIGTPLISSSGMVIIVSGKAYGIDSLSGKIVWNTTALGSFISSSPTFTMNEEFIIFTAASALNNSIATFFSLHSTSGKVYFSQQLVQSGGEPTSVFSSPVLYNDSVAIVAAGDSFYSIQVQVKNNSTIARSLGEILWKYSIPSNKLLSTAAIMNQYVYFTTASRHQLVALNIDTGQQCWSEDLGAYSSSTPVIDKTRQFLYVTSSRGVHAIDIGYKNNYTDLCLTQDMISSNSAKLSQSNQSIYAATMSLRTSWTYSILMGITSVGINADYSAIYFGSSTSQVICINITRTFATSPTPNPYIQWTYTVEGSIKLSVPVVDTQNRVYVATDTGHVYIFAGSFDATKSSILSTDKLLLWTLTPEPMVPIYSSLSITPNGSVIIATSNGNILSINTFAVDNQLPPPDTSLPVISEIKQGHWTIGQIVGLTIGLLILICLTITCLIMRSRKSRSLVHMPTQEVDNATDSSESVSESEQTPSAMPKSFTNGNTNDKAHTSSDAVVDVRADAVIDMESEGGTTQAHYMDRTDLNEITKSSEQSQYSETLQVGFDENNHATQIPLSTPKHAPPPIPALLSVPTAGWNKKHTAMQYSTSEHTTDTTNLITSRNIIVPAMELIPHEKVSPSIDTALSGYSGDEETSIRNARVNHLQLHKHIPRRVQVGQRLNSNVELKSRNREVAFRENYDSETSDESNPHDIVFG